jgi:AcrR family transcriptional regulator
MNVEAPSGGLRSRKKEKTRRAIEDAALELFAEHGYEATTVNQIAERAEVSTATFFRYFGTKQEVIFGEGGDEFADLRRAVVECPAGEDDLSAVRYAIHADWAYTLDAERTSRQARAAASSPLLRGLSFDLGLRWQRAISEGLAQRRQLESPDRRCDLVATVAFGVLSNGVNVWVRGGCSGDLGTAIDEAFVLLARLGTAFRMDVDGVEAHPGDAPRRGDTRAT